MDVTRPEVDPVGQLPHADLTRRATFRLGGGALAALLLAGSPRLHALAAQGATPAATPTGATGTTTQAMGVGQPASAPGLELSLRRITIAPAVGSRPTAIPAHW